MVSSPVDLEFEMLVVSCGLTLMKNMRNSKFPTSLAQDKKILSQIVDNWRFKLAVIHRINQKEILDDQVKLLGILLRILARIKEGAPSFKEAYCTRVTYEPSSPSVETENCDDVAFNRVKLRKYLQELSYYQETLIRKGGRRYQQLV